MEAPKTDNLSDKSTWVRLLYMILFFVIFNVAEVVTWLVVVIQFLFKLLMGRPNDRLRSFGESLATYFKQVVGFLTFHTDDLPYPFNPWPEAAAEGNLPATAEDA